MALFPDISSIIQNGTANPWLLLPAAVGLGALHALEPGHSKALMAGFIVAIRGTTAQAWLLGLSAAVGHTIIVWALALVGLYLGDKLIAERAEPWLLLLSGLLIVAMAIRMLLAGRPRATHGSHDHHHDHPHDHSHGGHGHGKHTHGGHNHSGHGHQHTSPEDLARTYQGRTVSMGEVAWFGFTGGLLPCPSAIAVLLVCLHLKAVGLGIAMVAAFSVGLAATLITVGVVAAWGTGRAAQAWSGFDRWAERLPFLSGCLVLLIGLAFTFRGLAALL